MLALIPALGLSMVRRVVESEEYGRSVVMSGETDDRREHGLDC